MYFVLLAFRTSINKRESNKGKKKRKQAKCFSINKIARSEIHDDVMLSNMFISSLFYLKSLLFKHFQDYTLFYLSKKICARVPSLPHLRSSVTLRETLELISPTAAMTTDCE